MGSPTKVLIDLNVVLDVLQKREPHYEKSRQILLSAEAGTIDGYLAAHSWTTLFYFAAKQISAESARIQLTQLLYFLKVAPVTQNTIERALNLPYRDFEDAVQMVSALESGASYVVIRNPKDYPESPVPVLLPSEMRQLL